MNSVNWMKLATIWARDYDETYKMMKPMTVMTPSFNLPNSRGHSRDILKDWVNDPTHFRMTPNQIYKTKILRKAYQYLVIFTYRLSGQASIEAFPQSWVVTLGQLAREGRAYN